MKTKLIIAAGVVLLAHNSAYAINAKYRQQLERSGCTQVSEAQGCDITKTKEENAKAGFVSNAPANNSSTASAGSGKSAKMTGPSFDCSKAKTGSIDAMVCGDEELSALDRKLADVYASASKKAVNERPPVLKAMQRGWIKGRDECWKDSDKRGCVKREYVRRIAELQATYRLVLSDGPARYTCDGNPANEVITTFFMTDPPTLIAERGDTTSLMYLEPSTKETRYQGRNEIFLLHGSEALITWGYNAHEMHCKRAP